MMRPLAFSVVTSLMVYGGAVWAQGAAAVDRLYHSLGMTQVIEIMREEGLAYGSEMEATFFDGQASDRWAPRVSEIYGQERMEAAVRARMTAVLEAEDLGAMLDFFDTDLGRRIITLEVSARRAFLEPDVEEASKAVYAAMVADKAPRVAQIEAYMAAGTLIENNLVGALNANVAFYKGLMGQGGAGPVQLSEEEILADVWGQEPEIRRDTTEWLTAYLALAYQPLTDAEMAAYVTFFETEAGRLLNRAIFEAFDALFIDISFELGRAAGEFLSSQEL